VIMKPVTILWCFGM